MTQEYFVTTGKIKDLYYQEYTIPSGKIVFVEKTTGSIRVVGEERVFVNYPPNNVKSFFRPPTPEELEKVKEILSQTPLTDAVPLSSGFTMGSDPEMFVVDKEGQVIPAFTFLPEKGTESVYWDGFQAEFTTIANCCLAFQMDRIHEGLLDLHTKARKLARYDARLTAESVLPIPRATLETVEGKFVELGCMPSSNAYNASGVQVVDGRELPIRFAGCHVHLGSTTFGTLPTAEIVKVVKTIDAIAGVASVALLEGLEHPLRRKYYGLAGEYRLPKHGLEYRVLSSTALWHPGLANMLFDLVRASANIGIYDQSFRWETSEEEVQEVINTLDVERARVILARNRECFESIIKALWGNTDRRCFRKDEPKVVTATNDIFNLFLTGLKQHIELDVEKNWCLTNGKWVGHCEGPSCQAWRAIRTWVTGEELWK